jgi:hypothetical protein
MTAGYEAARRKGELVAGALRDLAALIGDTSSQPLTLETGGQLTPGLGFTEDAAALRARARDLSQGLFTIIVLGEFKNGKSTLLNGMLGSKTLPAKAAPATAIITELVYGESDRVAIFETGAAEPRQVSWEDFVREFQLSREDQETLEGYGAIDRFSSIEYARIECRHPICAHGVKLIDSPGLGEHISRTRVATSFLKQAEAVIFVLNATRILTRDEREFIDTVLGEGRLPHVFFVVNRINQIDPTGVEEIRQWVERALAPHFRDERGDFDRDLYERRVFFVNARGALEARSGGAADEAAIEATGVPALERELERFLTGEDKVAAAVQSTVQFLGPVLTGAQRRIERQKHALDEPLEALEQRRQETERRLEGLQRRRGDIERTIILFADAVKYKVYSDLRRFVDEMHETWGEDSRRLIDLSEAAGITNVLQSYMQPEARERMAASIAEQVQRYLQVKFGEWSERIPHTVQPDVDAMVAEVEAQVEDFQLELEQIAAMFAGTPPGQGERVSGARLVQLALSLEDIAGLTDEVTGVNDWKDVIGRWVQQSMIVMLVRMLFTGSAMMALLFVELVNLGVNESEVKRRIRERLGQKLHEGLRAQVEERRTFILDTVATHFRQFATSMTEVLRTQIEEVRNEESRIVRQKQDEHFSAEQEKARLDAIGVKLEELRGVIGDVASQPALAH